MVELQLLLIHFYLQRLPSFSVPAYLLHLLTVTRPLSVVTPLSAAAAKLLRPCLQLLHSLMKLLPKSAVVGLLLPGCL